MSAAKTLGRKTALARSVPAIVERAITARADPTTVGGRLLICRKAKGIRQAEAARVIGIKQPTLGDLESGDSKMPRADTLLNMRDRLGYNPDFVIRGKGMPLLPNFEEMAQEAILLLMYRELRPALRQEAIRILRGLCRAQGGANAADPFGRDPPTSNTE